MRTITLDIEKNLKGLALVGAGAATFVFGMLVPQIVFGQSLGDAATSITDEMTNFGGLARAAFALVGLVLAGVGVIKIINAKKTNEPLGLGIGMTMGGAVLLALPILIQLTSQTAVQDDASGGLDAIGVDP